MIDYYKQLNLFDNNFDEDEEEVCEYNDYILTQSPDKDGSAGLFEYRVYDFNLVCIVKWKSRFDALNMTSSEFRKNIIYNVFVREVDKDIEKHDQELAAPKPIIPAKSSYRYTEYKPDPEAVKKQVEKYTHSDTLVIHKSDPTTTMLNQIYAGKGWDVVNDTNSLSKEALHQLLQNHKRLVLLGHGSSYGLMGSVDPSCAPDLEGKDLFVIWCNADKYFDRYLPNMHGFFCTKNAPSDAAEASWVGYHVSEQYMLENITYWCKLCGDVVEQALNGDAAGAVKYVREKYQEKYGNTDNPDEKGVTDYNTDSVHVQ